MGQRLALKHLLVDPKQKEKEEAAKAAAEAAALKAADQEAESSEAESEWTWETCSESEAEELQEDKAEPTPAPVRPVTFCHKRRCYLFVIDRGSKNVHLILLCSALFFETGLTGGIYCIPHFN